MSITADFFRNRHNLMIDLRQSSAVMVNRIRKAIKRKTTIVGRLHCEIASKMTALSQAVQDSLGARIHKAKRLIAQSRSKKTDKQPKLYSLHAPAVKSHSKGKSRNPYEFGVKVGIDSTLQGTLIVGARAFPGNPYDGHTLSEQVEQASILMQALDTKPHKAIFDLAYLEVDKANPDIEIKHQGKLKSPTDEDKKDLKRRQAI